jgi:hypothetical protein
MAEVGFMAVLLEEFCVITPIGRMTSEHSTPVGYLNSTAWRDEHLYCESYRTQDRVDARIQEFIQRGFQISETGSNPVRWIDLCLAHSGHGPQGICNWLEYDAQRNCVWFKGTESGAIVGGCHQYQELRLRLVLLRSMAEVSYTRMYDSRSPRDERDDALGHLSKAMEVAKLLNDQSALDEFKTRYDHIFAVWRSQFRY